MTAAGRTGGSKGDSIVSSSNVVRVERDGELASVIVHNPPVNTITAAVRSGLAEALDQIQASRDVRGVLLLCEGNTFFPVPISASSAARPRKRNTELSSTVTKLWAFR